MESIQAKGDSPMEGSVDKFSIQIGIVLLTYLIAYGVMYLVGLLLPGMRATIYGFNFLFGVLFASLINHIVKRLRTRRVMKKQYVNSFLMKRVAGFFFDLMVVSGVASIQFEALRQYWLSFLILGVVGALSTYFYLRFICKKLFPAYVEEQFLMMYGMLTGTASTGLILLREKDNHLESPAADNMVYQNLPAIVFGFPLLFIATLAPSSPENPYNTVIALGILIVFFVILNLILFRKNIFKRKRKKDTLEEVTESTTESSE
jgi:ESS family glutamate:Na+ symporter